MSELHVRFGFGGENGWWVLGGGLKWLTLYEFFFWRGECCLYWDVYHKKS